MIDADYTGRAGMHCFRHSLATVLIVEEKVDPKTAQGILRHTDAALTMNIYTHAQDPAKRAALEKFEQRLVQKPRAGKNFSPIPDCSRSLHWPKRRGELEPLLILSAILVGRTAPALRTPADLLQLDL